MRRENRIKPEQLRGYTYPCKARFIFFKRNYLSMILKAIQDIKDQDNEKKF